MVILHAFAFPRSPRHDPPFLSIASRSNGGMFVHRWRAKSPGIVSCISDGRDTSAKLEKKRKVVEHLCLLKAKEDLSKEEEKDMLDYLYTSQYQMRGIVAISLGNISDRNEGDYTHALYMRFQRKEDLEKFYENPFFLKVLQEHVTPYCHGLINVDYESEVEDDILPIFRKGEEFNYGEEFVLLIAFAENASDEHIKDALKSFRILTASSPSLIVQSTIGSNLNGRGKEFTHAAVVRFRSLEAWEIFLGGSEYKNVWGSKFEPIIEKAVGLHFSVDPVGTDIM
ncbi:PREDICTED: uncharacterized protein LOC104800995 [Tarenaya hassleriana]|uniref:uncharacterized protein LOC104800995 n=1 Tax=Tarenaya hassleriana TaxID=28532 RepID=UPI00053C71D4|nr:PREDICTED: uncharacterized protein LOC104800995 [Tarenaya hassleriana]XP_010522350.1 PREDICTED: uncharacterized protein LOC104800995 [Tarenaya hassleriana]